MEKTLKLFKKFLPAIIITTLVGLIFGFLTLLYYYIPSIPTITFKAVIPILTLVIFVLIVAMIITFAVKTKKLHISRVKRDAPFSKFAAALAGIMVAALFLFDFFRFVISPGLFAAQPEKIIRLFVFVPFVIYFVIQLIPKKMKRQAVILPKWLKPLCSVCAILWCVCSLVSIFRWTGLPITNIFKLSFIAYTLLALIFFLSEAKFELLKPNHRFYMISAFLLFSYTVVVSGSIVLGKLLGTAKAVTLSEFELICSITLGIYALSKMFAILRTLSFLKERSSTSTYSSKFSNKKHHHGHHHSHHKTTTPVTEKVTTDNVTPTDTEVKTKE
ncbi:MAG: hypothetical protein J6B34_02885 [Clostridia bacterium]|nr:hypothetical protein [Clostridia bacterium]